MARRVGVQRREGVALLTLGGAEEGSAEAGYDLALRQALALALDEAFATPDLRAIVLRAGAGGWPVARDPLSDFEPVSPSLATLCARLAEAPVPVVAVLSGQISGGGLALSQAAVLRLALASARFSSPEARLGLLAGAGTTVRLVRRAGAVQALEFLLSGKAIAAQAAMQLGLCDAVASEGTLETAALAEALKVAALETGAPLAPRETALANPGAALDALTEARARFAEGPLAKVAARLADVAEAALMLPLPAALDFEAVAFDDLAQAETSAALRAGSAARRAAGELAGIAPGEVARVTRVALWNPSDRQVLALIGRGLAVQVGCSTPERLQEMLTTVARAQEAAVAAGRVDAARRAADWARLDPVATPDAFGPADLLLAVPGSDAELAELRLARPEGTVLALSGALPRRGELGFERNRGLATVWATAPDLSAELPRLAAVLRADGALVVHARALMLRLEAIWFSAAERLVLAGAKPGAVDAALTAWGFPEGPFARIERLGEMRVAARLAASGIEVAPVLLKSAPPGALPPDAAEIVARMLAELAGAGAVALETGAAFRAGDIDLAAAAELGFPQLHGGPMFQADRIGALALRKRLRALAAEGAPAPSALLDRLIRDGRSFAELYG